MPIKNKIEIGGIAVITALLAGALISNLGFSSTNVLAQTSQNTTTTTAGGTNATQQQPEQSSSLERVLNFSQTLRTLEQQLGLNTTSSPERIRDAVQQFTNSTNHEQLSQRLSEFAGQNGLTVTRLEPATPDGNIMNRLQNFTEMIRR